MTPILENVEMELWNAVKTVIRRDCEDLASLNGVTDPNLAFDVNVLSNSSIALKNFDVMGGIVKLFITPTTSIRLPHLNHLDLEIEIVRTD